MEDLPIYSESPLRTGLQFAALDRLKGVDVSAVWTTADAWIASLEGAVHVKVARETFSEVSKQGLLKMHSLLFSGQPGAGLVRQQAIPPLYRGQDCAPPEFLEKSLDNLERWLRADSFTQIHPLEQAALSLTRIVDIWPFESGNLTVAIIAGNLPLLKAGLTPFYVLTEHRGEFEKAIAQAMTIDMQPLINAIFRTVKKEMEALAAR